MTPQVAAGCLAPLFDGRPKLLVLAGLDAAEALALPGLALWVVPPGEAPLLHPWGAAPTAPGSALPAVPGQVLGIVAPDAATAAPLLAWWAAAGPAVPPLILAATGAAALPALAATAIAALAAQAAEATAAQQAMVTLRQDLEATRIAQAALRQAVTRLQPPATPLLVGGADPGDDAVAATAGRLGLSQALGARLEGLTAIALHLAAADAGPGAMLRVRLYGAESGRIAGAWRVPGAALAPGWLTLDLPEPAGPVRETAWLDIRAELGPVDRLALSLAAEPATPGHAVAVDGGAAEHRSLAHGLWTAPPGRRLVQPLHWDAEAIGLEAPPEGVLVALPEQIWPLARVPEGRVERLAIGAEPARLMATLAGGEQALIVWPAVPLNGLDLLVADLSIAIGDATGLEAALWLQPAGSAIERVAALAPDAPGARWSGWHGAAAAAGGCSVALALPPDPPRLAAVALVLRNRGARPEDLLRVEIAGLAGRRQSAPPAAAAPRGATRLRPLPRAVATAPVAASVRLVEQYLMPGGDYRHLDMQVDGVRAGDFSWPRLRFKLALSGGAAHLEFRQRPDWPVVFETWPASGTDQAGPFLQLRDTDLAGRFAATLGSARDRAMLETVARLLPAVTATAARDATVDPAEYDRWVAGARELAAAVGQG